MNTQHTHKYPFDKYVFGAGDVFFPDLSPNWAFFIVFLYEDSEKIISNIEITYNATNTENDFVVMSLEYVPNPQEPLEAFEFLDAGPLNHFIGINNVHNRIWVGMVCPISTTSDDSVNLQKTKINSFRLPKNHNIWINYQRNTTHGGDDRFTSFTLTFDILDV